MEIKLGHFFAAKSVNNLMCAEGPLIVCKGLSLDRLPKLSSLTEIRSTGFARRGKPLFTYRHIGEN